MASGPPHSDKPSPTSRSFSSCVPGGEGQSPNSSKRSDVPEASEGVSPSNAFSSNLTTMAWHRPGPEDTVTEMLGELVGLERAQDNSVEAPRLESKKSQGS